MDKIVIYDTETTNSTIWGSIIEVGAVVVDKNLKEIGKLNIRGRMPEGEVPSAKALALGTSPSGILPLIFNFPISFKFLSTTTAPTSIIEPQIVLLVVSVS